MNFNSGLRCECRDQRQEVCAPQPDAAGGGRKTVPGNVNEHGAAASGNSGPDIVIDLDNDVVEAVAAAEPVAWFIGRPPKGEVITAIRRVLAPRVVRGDPAHGEQGLRPRQAIRPPPQPNRVKRPGRRAAIALALRHLDAGAAQRQRERSGRPRTASLAFVGPAAS